LLGHDLIKWTPAPTRQALRLTALAAWNPKPNILL
jgi:hypothetical protein